jgi:hypothetical protein
VVHITTPPESHLPLGKLALEAGCHIYLEKPFALSRAEAADISVFYSSVRGERPVPLSYRDILRVSGLMDRIFEQLEQRRAA